jgi:hypothetical protein
MQVCAYGHKNVHIVFYQAIDTVELRPKTLISFLEVFGFSVKLAFSRLWSPII